MKVISIFNDNVVSNNLWLSFSVKYITMTQGDYKRFTCAITMITFKGINMGFSNLEELIENHSKNYKTLVID